MWRMLWNLAVLPGRSLYNNRGKTVTPLLKYPIILKGFDVII